MPKKTAEQDPADTYRGLLRKLLEEKEEERKTETRRRMGGYDKCQTTVGTRAIYRQQLGKWVEGKGTPSQKQVEQIPRDYGLHTAKTMLAFKDGSTIDAATMVEYGMAWVEQVEAEKKAAEQEKAQRREQKQGERTSRIEKAAARASQAKGKGHYGLQLVQLMADRFYVQAAVPDRIAVESIKGRTCKKGVSSLNLEHETLVDQNVISGFRNGKVPPKGNMVAVRRQQLAKLLTLLKADPQQTQEILDGYDAAVEKAQKSTVRR